MFYTPTKDMFTRSAVDTKKQTGKKTTLSNIEMFWFAYFGLIASYTHTFNFIVFIE